MILEKQLLLPINLGRVLKLFPNYLESIILQRERLITKGKTLKSVVSLPKSGFSSKLRPYNAQRNCKKPKGYISDSTGLS